MNTWCGPGARWGHELCAATLEDARWRRSGPAPEAGQPTGACRIPAHLRPRPALDYELDKKPEHRVLWVLRSLTPGLNFLATKYSRRWLRADSIAGVAVAAYLIPQVMAYSAIVNVPPVASLWTALAAIVAYVVLGSSRILSSGPESTIALMTGVAIAPLAAQNPDRAVALSAALALIVAGWALLARLLRAGIIAELLSTPLLVGYLAGGAVLMVVGQLGKVTGTSFEGGTIVEEVRGFLGVATETDWLTLAVAASTLAVILLLRWLAPSLPGPLIAVVLATVASVVFDLESYGVAVVGQVPSGLPVPHLPDVTFEDVKMLLLAGLGITIVGYSDIMLIARGFPLAPAEGETAADLRPDPQAELVAMAGVHAMVGVFSGYPVSASGSRTALAIAGGARSQVYSLVAGVVRRRRLVLCRSADGAAALGGPGGGGLLRRRQARVDPGVPAAVAVSPARVRPGRRHPDRDGRHRHPAGRRPGHRAQSPGDAVPAGPPARGRPGAGTGRRRHARRGRLPRRADDPRVHLLSL